MKKRVFPAVSEKELAELERSAWNGVLDFNSFPAAEYKFFDTVQEVGHRFREGYPVDFCKADIDAARKEYFSTREDQAAGSKVYATYQEALKRSAELRKSINKTSDVYSALSFALECIELLTGEVGFKGRVLRNIEA